MTENTQTGDVMVDALASGGVEYLFFSSGSEVIFFQEAIAKAHAQGRQAPKLILMTHEYASLNAALGYAAVTGKAAATTAHVDVGTQHYGCAIHTAYHSGLPVLITAGAPPLNLASDVRGGRDGGHFWLQQSRDQHGIVRPYVKWDYRLESQDNPGLIVSRALQVARSEPCGPVYLSMPREVILGETARRNYPTADQLCIARAGLPDPQYIDEIAQRLTKARNPAVVVSRSGRNPATMQPLVALCELLGMSVVDSAVRTYHCFPFDHPLCRGATDLRDADVVLVLECDVPWVPGVDGPNSDAYVAVIDVDPVKTRIPTFEFTSNLRLIADSTRTLTALLSIVEATMDRAQRAAALERNKRAAAAAVQRWDRALREAQEAGQSELIDPKWLAYQINQVMDENCILVDDTLSHNPLGKYLKQSRPGTYFRNPGSAGGWGAGAALGMKLGRPNSDVVMATGDGFYMYSSATAAIWAAARYKAPFMTIVFNNQSYSTTTSATKKFYPGGFAERSGLEGGYFDPSVDFAKEAEAAGGYGENVTAPAEVLPALQRGLQQTRRGVPAVISVSLPRIGAQTVKKQP